MAGYGWSLAWRVYDAQYWGVPQRRKRIYLVADFGSERAPEILFEREGVCWNPAQGRAAREGATADAERSTGRSGGVRCLNPWDSQSIRQYDVNGIAPNIKAARNGEPAVCALDCRNMTGNEELSGTLQAKNEGGFSLNFVNPVVYAQQRIGQYAQDTIGSTEMARDYKSAKDLVVESSQPPRKYIVRRLTPLECVRLQGYPDCWLDGVEGSDSAKYKALGNSLAIPCAFDVMNRIARFVEREKED